MPLEPSPRSKKAIPAGVWTKCDKCEQIIYNKELEENFKICPKCGAHFRLNARERVKQLFDEGSFKEFGESVHPTDPLNFVDIQPYSVRLTQSQKKTGQTDACVSGEGTIEGHALVAALLDFEFMGGSMGSVVGEKVTLAIEKALKTKSPVLLVSASGGARMQESILSLMQMAKTSAALARLHEARIPFISLLTDPTTGGVTASFAMLGDLIVAEPKALIAFAGPRVIEQTIREQLPEGFQLSEFLLSHGMIDAIVERKDLKKFLADILSYFSATVASADPPRRSGGEAGGQVTYEHFLKNLNQRGMFRILPDLDRVRKVLRVLENPQDQIPAIHIAGTNGKGSVAAALESVLRSSGYRTGLYTSPHLVDLRERIKINGIPLIQGFTRIAENVLRAEKRAKAPLTYFELLTAMAFQTFAAKKVDVAIVECGLGGQWDATNILKKPILSIITSIGLDHTEWLGKDEYEIAAQKAGIIKRQGYVVSGVRGPGRSVITRIAREKSAILDQIDSTFRANQLTSSFKSGKQTIRFLYEGTPAEVVPFGLLGTHQVDNAAIVLASIHRLKQQNWLISDSKRDRGLLRISWPGRLQLIHANKSAPVLLDGAHNPPAMKQLLQSIESSTFKNVPKTFVFSAFNDKDYRAMAGMIEQIAAEVCLCSLPGPRGASIANLRSVFSNIRGPIRVFKSPHEALSNALHDTPRDGLVVVTGSLSLVGEVLRHQKQVIHQEMAHV